MKSTRIALAALVLAIVAAGCNANPTGPSGDVPPPPPPPPVIGSGTGT